MRANSRSFARFASVSFVRLGIVARRRQSAFPPRFSLTEMSDPSLSAMYQDALLAHYRAPHNRRLLAQASGEGLRRNPLCGDEIRVQVRLEGDVIADVAFTGQSCSITTASASMMTDVVGGRTVADAADLVVGLE